MADTALNILQMNLENITNISKYNRLPDNKTNIFHGNENLDEILDGIVTELYETKFLNEKPFSLSNVFVFEYMFRYFYNEQNLLIHYLLLGENPTYRQPEDNKRYSLDRKKIEWLLEKRVIKLNFIKWYQQFIDRNKKLKNELEQIHTKIETDTILKTKAALNKANKKTAKAREEKNETYVKKFNINNLIKEKNGSEIIFDKLKLETNTVSGSNQLSNYYENFILGIKLLLLKKYNLPEFLHLIKDKNNNRIKKTVAKLLKLVEDYNKILEQVDIDISKIDIKPRQRIQILNKNKKNNSVETILSKFSNNFIIGPNYYFYLLFYNSLFNSNLLKSIETRYEFNFSKQLVFNKKVNLLISGFDPIKNKNIDVDNKNKIAITEYGINAYYIQENTNKDEDTVLSLYNFFNYNSKLINNLKKEELDLLKRTYGALDLVKKDIFKNKKLVRTEYVIKNLEYLIKIKKDLKNNFTIEINNNIYSFKKYEKKPYLYSCIRNSSNKSSYNNSVDIILGQFFINNNKLEFIHIHQENIYEVFIFLVVASIFIMKK